RDRLPGAIIPVAPQALGDTTLPGSMNAPLSPPAASRGPGTGDGAGINDGSGDGPGRGHGVGNGFEQGIGDGPYRPGGDVTMPIQIRKGTPRYTTDAMRARAQGAITVPCGVQTIGVCTNIVGVRSFNPSVGPYPGAVKAATP